LTVVMVGPARHGRVDGRGDGPARPGRVAGRGGRGRRGRRGGRGAAGCGEHQGCGRRAAAHDYCCAQLRLRAALTLTLAFAVLAERFIATGVQFGVRALVSDLAALAEVPLFLLALLVVRAVHALAYVRLIGKRRASSAGLMQAATLTFVVVASQIGIASGQVSGTTGAALLAAGLTSAARR
jgi:hypothetical protein